MCGILGAVNRPFGVETLSLLHHRGPDDGAIVKERIGEHEVTLGHRRLAILDLSPAGSQPMSTPCGNWTIVFNGEVYNHLDLRKRTPGVTYRGHSDTESILHCLARRGILEACRFNGIFAFALADRRGERLLLARDTFGVKPLYYYGDGRSFLFSSELRPLLQLAGDEVSIPNLAELLRLRYLPAPDTLFGRIRKVRPGHVVDVNLAGSELTIREFPFLEEPPAGTRVSSCEQALAEYGFLVERAIKRQLMADVEIGVFLSGGIDSAMVASIAQRNVGYRMKAFTVGFEGRTYADETADARESARTIGLEHHDVRVGFADFMTLFPFISAIVEEPLATTSMVPMFHLSELAAGHGKVMLSGQGADEAMGGYRRYRLERARAILPEWAIRSLCAALRKASLRSDALQRGIDSIHLGADVARFEAVSSVFSADEIERLIGHRPARAADRIQYFYDLLRCPERLHSVERMMAIDLRMGLADDLLLYTDKITMHHSIECRVPLLDLDLVRYVESLPLEYRVGLLRGKLLHRQYARRLLPRSIVDRPKKGFLSPTAAWFRNTTRIRETLLDHRSRFASHLDLVEVDRVLREHADGMNRERQIFLLLSLYHWFAGLQNQGAAPFQRGATIYDLTSAGLPRASAQTRAAGLRSAS